jgi:hypothetical protein
MKTLLDFKEAIKKHNPCVERYRDFLNAANEKERAEVVVKNLSWCVNKGLLELIKATHSVTDITEGIKVVNWLAVRWAAYYGHLEVLNFFNSITEIPQ